MATMVKEKHRDKKKSKTKTSSKNEEEPDKFIEDEKPSSNLPENVSTTCNVIETSGFVTEMDNTEDKTTLVNPSSNLPDNVSEPTCNVIETSEIITEMDNTEDKTTFVKPSSNLPDNVSEPTCNVIETSDVITDLDKTKDNTTLVKSSSNLPDSISEPTGNVIETCDIITEKDNTEDKTTLVVEAMLEDESFSISNETQENIEPSAPILEQNEAFSYIPLVEEVKNEDIKAKIKCLPLDEAIRLFGGKEIDEVRAISEFEDAKIEGGPQCEPFHPLIDYLSTFRSSLKAVERERNRITNGFIEEEKSRATLWKVNKRSVNVSEKCPCGAPINFRVTFDIAQLDKERLPAARMQLESLTLEVDESYCHHQHIALQTHYDIDEYLYEVLQTHKDNIRDSLSLVFQSLRMSDGAPETYAQALQRWCCILSTTLLDGDCVMQYLMFFLHSLFRQTRSVQWAAHVFSLQVTDMSSAARLLGILEAILTHPVLESAQECSEETWEELDDLGEGCAVGEGRLRERDMLTLLHALPLRDLLARLVLFMRQDISQETDQYWGDHSGGHGVLKSTCGVRTLLHILQKAHDTHSSYAKLQRKLKHLAVSALTSLAALHLHSSTNYSTDLEDKIKAELQACFAAGVNLLQDETYKIPATLLTPEVAMEFSGAFFFRLHDVGPIFVETLSLELPIHLCLLRTRIAAQVALDRELDSDLARLALENLFQIGIRNTLSRCQLGCDVVARDLLPQLLAVHPRLHTLAFQMFAEASLANNIDPEVLASLSREHWRPNEAEARGILTEWAVKCFDYIQHLLPYLDYTPHTGLSLETQLMIGEWICEFSCRGDETPEWAWQVLRLLSVHRSQWKYPLDAPPHGVPKNMLSMAFTLLASDWGHSLPLICGPGVEALYQLAVSRPTDAVHCVSNIMQVMALSPESVSLTPKFTEIFSVILGSGPNLIQRALGRRDSNGHDLLQRLLALQMEDAKTDPQRCSPLLSAWLHALWKPSLPASSRAVLDVAVRTCRDWRTLDMHSNMLLQEENAKDYIVDAVRHAALAPLLCESILRSSHTNEINSQMYARLLEELVRQKAASQKIHVDNALKQIGMSLTDDDLVIHQCACAVLVVSLLHPAHILLWRLLLHMFLQRPPAPQPESLPPVGPLFFSGMIKSRTLSHLKKKLQETSLFHHTQIKVLKSVDSSIASTPTSSAVKASPSMDNDMFQALAIFDLTGVSNSQSECTLSEDSKDIKAKDTSEQDVYNLLQYHVGAEKLIREYLLWLEEGEKAHAQAYHADINRFLSEIGLDAAWRASLGTISIVANTPSATPTTSTTTTPEQTQITHLSHCERAVRAIMSIKDVTLKRYKIPALPQPLDDVYFTDSYLLLQTVDKYLNELKQLANEWNDDMCTVTHLDVQLWDYVRKLRVSRPLPAVRKGCSKGCTPITIQIPEDEWVISTGAQQGIQENRRSARAAIRHLSRPRPYVARLASIVHSMGSRIGHEASALKVAERAYEITAHTWLYAPAQDAVTALVSNIAQRFISLDSRAASDYLARWMRGNDTQKNLCTALIAPLRMNPTTWPKLYNTVLTLHLEPHVAFSFLSKFNMATWAQLADTSQRSEVLESLVKAALRMGSDPNSEEMVLLEILCKHSGVIVQQKEVHSHILRCAHASVSCHLPPFYCQHLPEIAIKFSHGVDFDQLGHLLRELGLIFWEARCSSEINRELYAKYAPHFTKTLYNLLKRFVAAALYRGYEPETVANYASSALHESWSAWVAPHSSPPLIPDSIDNEEFSSVLKLYTDAIVMIMEDAPGCSGYVLRYVWEWTVNTFMSVEDGAALGGGLLAQLELLPWNQPWFHVDCLLLVPKITTITDQKLRSWCNNVMRHIKAKDWLTGAVDENIPINLLAALSLLTSKQLVLPAETLEEACKLPWYRLPVPAVEEALQKYFADHYTLSLPYHQQPHFRVMLSACQLIIPESESANRSAQSSEKRTNSISLWMRASTTPALKAHVREYTLYQLETLTNLAPHIEVCEGELEALIGRAVVIMCMEPAAAIALPVWENWISTCPPKVRRACATAVATLTTMDYFAVLANAVAKAIMNEKETASWLEMSFRWTSCPWWQSSALLVRKRLYAAYAMLHAHEHSHRDMRLVFRTLLNGEIDFSENEIIISVWICVAGRVIVQNMESEDEAASSERRECVEAARTLLMRWAEQRRSLLQLVTMHPAGNCPMTQHRVLCRLALCIVSPSDSAARSYESAVTSLLSSPDVLAWSRARQPRTLPRLACRLYPAHEVYFKEEQELVPEDI